MNFAIIAGGPGWVKAPKDFGKGWRTIVVSYVYTKYRADFIVDMHNEETIMEHHKLSVSLAKQDNIPYYCLDKYKSVPTSVRYPIEKIIETFSTDYFNSSVDYAIALALYWGAKKINIYGISLSTLDEYLFQKPSIEAWLWYAKGKGVEVKIGDLEKTALFHTVRLKGGKIYATPTNTMYGYFKKQKLPGWVGYDEDYNFENNEDNNQKEKL